MTGKRYPPRIDRICSLKLDGIKRILDVGCGDGKYAIAIGNAFGAKELYGIDLGEEAVRLGRSKGVNIACSDLNQSEMPYPDSFFDLVFSGEIIEHLLNPDRLLNGVRRVLKPGGYFALTTPNIANWYDRLILLLGWQPYSIPTHSAYRGVGTFLSKARNTTIRDHRYTFTTGGCGLAHIQFFTHRSIKMLVKLHGFDVLKVWGTPADQFTFPVVPVVRRLLIMLDRMVSALSVSLSSGIIIIARADKDA